MDKNKKREIAESAYIDAVACLKRILNVKRGNTKNSTEYNNALFNFESAVQGVLLYATIDIGTLTPYAKEFITENRISGDILKHVNAAGKRKLFAKWETLNWDNIDSNDMPGDIVKEAIKEGIEVCTQNFVFPISALDADITSKSFADEISAYIKTVIQAVCSPDFYFEKDGCELNYEQKIEIVSKTLDAITAGIKVFNDAFLVYWKNSNELD